MNRYDQYLRISCYRYAPEQFRACRIVGYSHGNRNIPLYEQIPLTPNEAWTCGYALVCKGYEQGLAELKRILRAKQKAQKLYCFFGYRYKDSKTDFAYFTCDGRPVGLFQPEDLHGALAAYKEVTAAFAALDWKTETTRSIELNGLYQPIKETETVAYQAIDPTKPILRKVLYLQER